MSSYLTTLKDSSINGIVVFLLMPVSFISLPILTNNLSLIDYGLWGLIFYFNKNNCCVKLS